MPILAIVDRRFDWSVGRPWIGYRQGVHGWLGRPRVTVPPASFSAANFANKATAISR
jgi:hypothetical protein